MDRQIQILNASSESEMKIEVQHSALKVGMNANVMMLFIGYICFLISIYFLSGHQFPPVLGRPFHLNRQRPV